MTEAVWIVVLVLCGVWVTVFFATIVWVGWTYRKKGYMSGPVHPSDVDPADRDLRGDRRREALADGLDELDPDERADYRRARAERARRALKRDVD